METFKTKILNHNIKKLKQPKLQTAKKKPATAGKKNSI